MEALSGRRLETTGGQIRQAITQNEVIASHIPDGHDVRVVRLRASLRGSNMVTPYFACYVEDEDGDIAEITFDVNMRPLSDDPIYGVTYRRQADGSSNDKDGACHSINELVAKLFPSKVES